MPTDNEKVIDLLSNLDISELQALLGSQILKNISIIQKQPEDSFQTERKLASLVFGKYKNEIFHEDTVRENLLSVLPDDQLKALEQPLRTEEKENFDRKTTLQRLKKEKFKGEFATNLLKVLDISEEFIPSSNYEFIPFEILNPTWPVFDLFEYQQDISKQIYNSALRGEERNLVHMPTGSGKTRTCLEGVIAAWKDSKEHNSFIVWLAPSQELCEQAAATIKSLWIERGNRSVVLHNIWHSARPEHALEVGGFVVATMSTMWSMLNGTKKEDHEALKTIRNNAFCVVVDEAHHSVARTYKGLIETLVGSERSIGRIPSLFGLTATPGRNEDTTGNYDLADMFSNSRITIDVSKMSDGKKDEDPIEYLQRNEYLAKLKHFELETGLEFDPSKFEKGQEIVLKQKVLKELSGDIGRNKVIVNSILQQVEDKHPTLVFTCGVEHSQMLSAILGAFGVNAVSISGSTPQEVRTMAIGNFKKGDGSVPVLLNYDILSTGFDAPKLKSLVIARPIFSVVQYGQILGRALRGPKMKGQAECRVIDIKDNYSRIPGIEFAFSYFSNYWR
jgi:superfamily II DNA or RNA helicase